MTQREVDDEILELQNNCEPNGFHYFVWNMIGKWLTIDPDARPFLSECRLKCIKNIDQQDSEEKTPDAANF